MYIMDVNVKASNLGTKRIALTPIKKINFRKQMIVMCIMDVDVKASSLGTKESHLPQSKRYNVDRCLLCT